VSVVAEDGAVTGLKRDLCPVRNIGFYVVPVTEGDDLAAVDRYGPVFEPAGEDVHERAAYEEVDGRGASRVDDRPL
jgi:hypothetical protein